MIFLNENPARSFRIFLPFFSTLTEGSFTMSVTEQTIDELIATTFVSQASLREQYFFRESLRNLVRLAKAEQMRDMRLDVARVTQGVNKKASIPISPN